MRREVRQQVVVGSSVQDGWVSITLGNSVALDHRHRNRRHVCDGLRQTRSGSQARFPFLIDGLGA